jgi:preprotein translocase subunit SecE
VARNRQRAKQRQAERRARRLEQQERDDRQRTDGGEARSAEGDGAPAVADVDDPRAAQPAPGIDPSLAVGAPPQDEGRSAAVVEDEPELEEEEEHLEDFEIEEEAEAEEAEDYAPVGRRAEAGEAEARDRPRFIQFLIACWAELQRVQWPKRQALTTLTGVVLGFVLIAGGYLGLLDAIFSRLIQAIL